MFVEVQCLWTLVLVVMTSLCGWVVFSTLYCRYAYGLTSRITRMCNLLISGVSIGWDCQDFPSVPATLSFQQVFRKYLTQCPQWNVLTVMTTWTILVWDKTAWLIVSNVSGPSTPQESTEAPATGEKEREGMRFCRVYICLRWWRLREEYEGHFGEDQISLKQIGF